MGLLPRPFSLLDPAQVAYQREHVQAQHPYLSEVDANHRALARCVGLKQVKPATAKALTFLAALLIILLLVGRGHAQNVHVLGPVTVTQGTAGASPWLVSGNIAVSWAAAQHIICDSGCGSSSVTQGTSPWVVSGAVTASWAAAQHVIVDTAPTTAVTGTFWQTTQPISGSISNAFLLDATFTGRIPVLGQKAMSGSVPVVISSDQSSLAFDPQGPDAQGAAQTGKPVQNGGRAGDGTIHTFATDSSGNQQMGIVGTVTLGNLPQQPFLNTTDFTDVVAGSPVLGDTIYSNSTPKWTKLAGATTGGGGAYLNQTEGVLAAPSAPTLTVSNTGGSFSQASLITAYVVVTLNNAFGESTPSPESSILVSTANGCLAASTTCSVSVTQPTLTGNATGYTVYDQRDSGVEKQHAVSNNCVNVTGTCILQVLGQGSAPPTVNTASNGTLVPPTWVASTGTGAPVLAAQATFIAKSINKTLHAEAYANGGDMCYAIAATWLALPSTGGTIDATGYQGAQNCAQDPFVGGADIGGKAVELILGNVTIAATTQWSCWTNMHAHGLGDMTVIAFQPAVGAAEATKADLWLCDTKTNVEIDHLKVTGTANTARLISFRAVTSIGKIHDVTCSGPSYIPVAGPNACIFTDQSADIWITNNVVTNTGPGPASSTASVNGDIVIWQTTAQNRIHVRNNQISGSHTSASIQMYDCQDCDALDNTVDQNNTITTNLTVGGYAILSYQSVARPRNIRIEGNHVTNCAGACIYVLSNNQAIVIGNTVLTAGQQETDGTLPVAGIAVSDCLYCVVGDNLVKTSTKDGITGAAPLTGTIIHHNSIFTVTQHGIQLRGAVADATVSDNIIDTPTSRGIYASTSTTRVIIKGNQIKGSLQNAMEFTSATDMDISHNILSGWPTALNALVISGGSGNTVCNNDASTGLTNAIGFNLTMNTSIICNNNLHNFGGAGIFAVMNDGEIAGNICNAVVGACINDTGSLRNKVFGNHLVASGAMTLVASDFIFGNEQDASGAVSRGNDMNLMVTGSNFVTAANTNLQTITGLSFTFPANMALNANVDCDLNYSQQTAAVADAFGFQDATVAPSNLGASGFVQTAITTWVDSTLTASSTTTATNIVAMTPSAITTIWHAKLHIGIEQPSNASTSLFSVMVKTGTAADTVTVFRGSGCSVHFQ